MKAVSRPESGWRAILWAPLSPWCFWTYWWGHQAPCNWVMFPGWTMSDGCSREYPNTSPFRSSHSTGPCLPKNLQWGWWWALRAHCHTASPLLSPASQPFHLQRPRGEQALRTSGHTLPQSLIPWDPLHFYWWGVCALTLSPLFFLS